MRQMLSVVGVTAVLAALGCANVPRPNDELAQSESAMRSAEEFGAGQIPQAALELKLAQDELQTAQEQIKKEQNDAARQNLLRCRADAELALALTRQAKADLDAQGARDQLRAVQKTVQ